MSARAALAAAHLTLGTPIPGHPDLIYAGTMRGENGEPDYALAVYTGERTLRGVWGEWGERIEGAGHRRDGWANTQAMASSGIALAKAVLEEGLYIASPGEAQLICANLHDLMPKGWHWTSTQYSPYSAWVQDFEYGYSNVYYKSNEFRAVAVRRFNPSDFDPSRGGV